MTEQTNSELFIERIFNAPKELVWKAWTEPERFMLWWGPKQFTCPECTIDLRVGGRYLACMRSPEGQDFWSTGTYLEIVPFEKIVMTDSFSDKHGNIVSAAEYGMSENFPKEMLITLTFESLENGTTKISIRHSGLPAGEYGDMAGSGWNESLDKLAGIF